VRQLNANIATINTNMQSSIVASITELKEDMNNQLESVISMIYTKLHIPLYLTHLCIPKLKLPLIPIIFSPITFNVTYTFRRWM
jgi:hypothetical protein